MTQVSANAITSAVRQILNEDLALKKLGVQLVHRIDTLRFHLSSLEKGIPSRDPLAFVTPNLDAFGYATVLGYLNEQDPPSLMGPATPVRDTIAIGRAATALCLKKGLKVVKVPTCDHVKQRYAKVTHVNAYPVAVLAKIIFDAVQ